MRVLCIISGTWSDVDTGESHGYGPKYGEECTVIGEDGPGYYILEEYPFEPDKDSWDKKEFIPLTGEKESVEHGTEIARRVVGWPTKLLNPAL